MKLIPTVISVYSQPGKHTVFFDGAEQYHGSTEVHVARYLRRRVAGWPDAYDGGQGVGSGALCLSTFTRTVMVNNQ